MVVTNILEYGENMPHNVRDVAGISANDLLSLYIQAQSSRHIESIAHPVDGDALARQRAQEQHRRAEDASMTTLALVPWAQHQLEIDKCGATGLWLHSGRITESDGGTKVALPLGPVIHSYRRWADQ